MDDLRGDNLRFLPSSSAWGQQQAGLPIALFRARELAVLRLLVQPTSALRE